MLTNHPRSDEWPYNSSETSERAKIPCHFSPLVWICVLHPLRLHHWPHSNSKEYHTDLSRKPNIDVRRRRLVIKCYERKEYTHSCQTRRQYLSGGEFFEPEIIEEISLAKRHKDSYKRQYVANMCFVQVIESVHIEAK